MSTQQVTAADGTSQEFVATKTGAALPTILPPDQPISPAPDPLKLLARAMGRQAARRYLNRGYSIYEIAIFLAVGALIIGVLLYAGSLHSGSK